MIRDQLSVPPKPVTCKNPDTKYSLEKTHPELRSSNLKNNPASLQLDQLGLYVLENIGSQKFLLAKHCNPKSGFLETAHEVPSKGTAKDTLNG